MHDLPDSHPTFTVPRAVETPPRPPASWGSFHAVVQNADADTLRGVIV